MTQRINYDTTSAVLYQFFFGIVFASQLRKEFLYDFIHKSLYKDITNKGVI